MRPHAHDARERCRLLVVTASGRMNRAAVKRRPAETGFELASLAERSAHRCRRIGPRISRSLHYAGPAGRHESCQRLVEPPRLDDAGRYGSVCGKVVPVTSGNAGIGRATLIASRVTGGMGAVGFVLVVPLDIVGLIVPPRPHFRPAAPLWLTPPRLRPTPAHGPHSSRRRAAQVRSAPHRS